ncbi:uncharacterized protein [Chlorocebus sabaeus]|uniref:uncharacterized protein isoform X2 n=1 Tax=Chlorocebus sabaeus TaxID=60711 RepID=UPI003BF95FF4
MSSSILGPHASWSGAKTAHSRRPSPRRPSWTWASRQDPRAAGSCLFMAANVCVQEREGIDLCLDLKMEPKELEGIWACASGPDPARLGGPLGAEPDVYPPRTSHPATLQESAGPDAARLTLLPQAPAAEKVFGQEAILSVFKMSTIKGGKSSNANLISCHRSNLP